MLSLQYFWAVSYLLKRKGYVSLTLKNRLSLQFLSSFRYSLIKKNSVDKTFEKYFVYFIIVEVFVG